MGYNVPRICEVGRRPIWVERSRTAYSLLGAVHFFLYSIFLPQPGQIAQYQILL